MKHYSYYEILDALNLMASNEKQDFIANSASALASILETKGSLTDRKISETDEMLIKYAFRKKQEYIELEKTKYNPKRRKQYERRNKN